MMILGLVQWMQPVHGYDVRRELLSWSADKWANMQPGSIYHALRKLTEEGLLARGGHRAGRRPPGPDHVRDHRQGRGRVRDAAARPLVGARTSRPTRSWRRSPSCPPCPATEAAAALRNRASLLRAGVESMRAALESDWMRDTKPVHVGWMFELWSARAEAEIAWCERIAERIESGVSYLPAELDDAEGWPQWTDGRRAGRASTRNNQR